MTLSANFQRPVRFRGLFGRPTGTVPTKGISGLKKCQQVGVELVFVSVREAVRCARVDL